MKYPLKKHLLITVLAAAFTQSALAADPVATINGTAIPAAREEVLLKEQLAQGAKDNEELRKAVKEELIRREALAQKAVKEGFDKKTDVISQIDLARQAILIRAMLSEHVKKNPITDEAVKAEYENIKKNMTGKEYKSRHILVKTEDEAKKIIADLKAGKSFEELAKQSQDPGSKDHGGDLGWSNPNNFVKPFAEALKGLEKGKITEKPVKTDFGYHVIQMEDSRAMTPPKLENIEPQIKQNLQQKMVEELIKSVRDKADVK